jgi:hypothetical protein
MTKLSSALASARALRSWRSPFSCSKVGQQMVQVADLAEPSLAVAVRKVSTTQIEAQAQCQGLHRIPLIQEEVTSC